MPFDLTHNSGEGLMVYLNYHNSNSLNNLANATNKTVFVQRLLYLESLSSYIKRFLADLRSMIIHIPQCYFPGIGIATKQSW